MMSRYTYTNIWLVIDLIVGLGWQAEAELAEPKTNAKMIIRRLNRNSEPQASIEAGKYTLQCVPCLRIRSSPELINSQLPNTRPTLLPHHLR